MASPVHPRLDNLLGSLTLNLAQDAAAALERSSQVAGRAAAALLALEEFLGEAHVGQLSDVLGLTHSGAVRLINQLEAEGLAERSPGTDRRRVEVRLTARGRRRAATARAARDAIVRQSTAGLDANEVSMLEGLLAQLVAAQVSVRIERRLAGGSADDRSAWWCRTCNFAACGRPEGRCPAQVAAATMLNH
jgi:MarR family transcriptional repressor of emrRAB